MVAFRHQLAYPGDVWVDRASNIPVFKEYHENLKQRLTICHQGESDESAAADLCLACANSFTLWVNLFGWCIELVQATAHGNVPRERAVSIPFITWPVQDAAALAILDAKRRGRSVALEKARDMGASWLCLMLIAWDCLFHPGANWLLISRKEEEVWFPGDQKALFSKLLHIIDSLPVWMRPAYTLRERHLTLHVGGEDSGAIDSVVTGESTNSYAGVGDRRTGLFVDEAAAIDILRSIVANTSDTGPFRIYNSTNRAGSYFTTHLLPSGRCDVVQLPWYDHPIKGHNRRVENDERGEPKIVSDWYLAEAAKRDAIDVAENMDMERRGAGEAIFDSKTISTQKTLYAPIVFKRGNVELPSDRWIDPQASPLTWPLSEIDWKDSDARGGLLAFFGSMVPDDDGRMRPTQEHCYAIGADVGQGTGRNPSVASIVDCDTGFKIARWRDQWTTPDEFGEVLFLLAHWVGGRNRFPLLIVEANGPGAATLIRLRRLSYPRIYCHTDELRHSPHETPKLGWHSTRPGKLTMLEKYRGDLAAHRFKNPDAEALDQCLTYIHYERGGCGPSLLADMTEEQRSQHGDDVIADMLGNFGREKAPKITTETLPFPAGSFGDRQAQRDARDRAISKAFGRVRF